MGLRGRPEFKVIIFLGNNDSHISICGVKVKSKLMLVMATAMFLLSACASQVLSTSRTPGADLTVQGIRIVFEDSYLRAKTGAITSDNAINQQRLLLGNSIVEKLPTSLLEARFSTSARPLPSVEIPSSMDFSKYFQPEQKDWHVLIVTPISAKSVCTSACDYFFQLSLRLIEPQSKQAVWTATIDQPLFGAIGSRKAIYDSYADSISKILAREIRSANKP